jgi:hypothetical protein
MALWWLGHAQTLLEAQDYLFAEKTSTKAVTFHLGNPILHLFHGKMSCLHATKFSFRWCHFCCIGQQKVTF